MSGKLEILEALKSNIESVRDSDFITNEDTKELDRISNELEDAIRKERESEQIRILDERLAEAFKNDRSHTERLAEN